MRYTNAAAFFYGDMMKIGSLIAAAGCASRMGALKPLLPLGEETLLRQGIITMKNAGADTVVVVTGREAEQVGKSIADLGVITVCNKAYESTQMLDSVKMGLKELAGKCDRVLFAPADAPLYSPETVNKLIASDALICVPGCSGKTGHPVCFDSGLIEGILNYEGSGGLAGALSSLGEKTVIECEDPGAFMDADTPEDYQRMLDYYRKACGSGGC